MKTNDNQYNTYFKTLSDQKFEEEQTKLYKENNKLIMVSTLCVNILIFLFLQFMPMANSIDQVNINFPKYALQLNKVVIFLTVGLYLLFFSLNLNKKFSYILAIINYIMIDVPFIIIAGILRSYFSLPADSLMVVLVLEIFLRAYLVYVLYRSSIIYIISATFILIYNIVILYICHQVIPSAVFNYVFVKLILLIMLIFFTFLVQQKNIQDYSNSLKMELDKKYYKEILDEMSLGLFTMNNGKIMYNKVIDELLKDLLISNQVASMQTELDLKFNNNMPKGKINYNIN